VCPWNNRPERTYDPAYAPRADLYTLYALLVADMTDAEFQSRFRGTPLDRPGFRGLRRNAENVLRNTLPEVDQSGGA
ncbi:MAG: hypothetical protein AAF907_13285, partial [Planctomycetota bacterium]